MQYRLRTLPPRVVRWSIGAFAAVFALAGLISTDLSAAAQSNVGVFVAYADSARPDATSFPTPWLGSPNTTFEGCQPVSACEYDGGAIRIVNNGPTAITVDAIALHLDTCTYSGWAPAVLAPGADLIVTQLGSGVAAGCTGPVPNSMDLSDLGPGGTSWAGNCTQDGLQATVDVTIDGAKTTYTDSGQVLNTGGIDGASCGNPNESIQWTTIGHAPCRGSMLSLSPASQTDPILSTATLTATFTNSCGQPLSDVAVNMQILSGPNQGRTFSGTTDANGAATFSYSSSLVGTDSLQATVTNIGGTIPSNTATVNWIVNFAPGGGAFVISDLKATNAAPAYWWGAQWWKEDPLSTGLAPASFKGYENSNSTPWCGQTWTTRPGNSSRPPKAVAAGSDMAVIVSSAITKRGPVISGNVVAVVLVKTNAGYGPNPGHPGTGTIESVLCGQLFGTAPTKSTLAGPGSTKPASQKAGAGPKPAAKPQATSLPAASSAAAGAPAPSERAKHGEGVKNAKGRR